MVLTGEICSIKPLEMSHAIKVDSFQHQANGK